MEVLILCVHDGDHNKFLKTHPEFLDLYKQNKDLFIQYLNLERDHGASELALRLNNKLKAHSVDVNLINIKDVPRGIIDLNRIEEKAIREIFDFNLNPSLYKKLLKTYNENIDLIKESVDSLPKDGVFIDIHTMIDFTPKQSTLVNPGVDALRNYIDSCTNSINFAEKRDIEFLTAELGKGSIANPRVHRNLHSNFKNYNIKTVDNIPYWLMQGTMTAEYMKKYPGKGIAIDIPINELSEKTDHLSPILCPKKIDKIADIMFRSILKMEA